MATHRPIVSVGGGRQQLPPGDRLVGSQQLRVRMNNGDRAYLPLDENGELTIQLSSGEFDSVPVIGALYG